MGVRFRKSTKIAPGVKLNFNKKSVGITVGGKGIHYTINSSGKKTSSIGIPGTGLSYSTSSNSRNSKSKKSSTANVTASNGGNNNSGCSGCLLVFLGICLASIVLGFILNYAWIPGIIAAIYFAKKTPDKKQRNIRVGISIAVTLISFVIFLSSLFEPDLTDLTVNWGKQEYDITEEAKLDLQIIEEGAEIYSLSISDNDIAKVNYVDGVATVTFIGEGTADISFTANDEIQSNATTITVIDKKAEEQRAKEEAERKAQEEAEAEAQKKAEEEAKAQEEQKAEEQNNQNSETQQEEMVWIPSSGSKYHNNPNCSNMNNPTQVTESEALSQGYEPCKRCY